jgi:Enoyl-CoA hydratase/carnithine racemase
MSYEHVAVERDDRITIITINRPDVHNALNARAQQELLEAFDAFDADSDQWVAIATGAGAKAFCAGHDLKEQAEGGELSPLPKGFAGLTSRFDLSKPVIAAVNGAAMGGGFELALACDLIVASSNASFALPEPKVGLAALAGGIQRLPRDIGLKAAMGILLTGRRVSAHEGFELGFVNEVVEDDVLSAARRWAREIAEASPLAVRATKEAVLRGLDAPLAQSIGEVWHYPAMKAMLDSEDAIEGPAAFVDKRKPNWQGR